MNEFRQDDPVAVNKKISSTDFTPLYESTAVDVTCYMSEANMKEVHRAQATSRSLPKSRPSLQSILIRPLNPAAPRQPHQFRQLKQTQLMKCTGTQQQLMP